MLVQFVVPVNLTAICVCAGNVVLENLRIKENALVRFQVAVV